MVLLAPDILADACGLSLGLMLLAVPVGLVLWLFGWRSHRFWVVLLATVLAGVWGLHVAPAWQAPPLIAAVLLAFSAGVLALALVRLVAFAAGGLGGLLLVQLVYPSLGQPLVTFLACGLVCLFLFRPCLMALTSVAGAQLLTGAALMLLHYYAVVDAPCWCEQSVALVNWLVGLLAFVGFAVQFLLDRYFFRESPRGKSWVALAWGRLTAMLSSGGGGGGGSGRAYPTARRAA